MEGQTIKMNDDSYSFKNYDSFTDWTNDSQILGTSISIVSVNIRSIHKHWNELITILTNQQTLNFDLLIITETNTTKDNIEFYNLQGYDKFFYNRTDRRGGGVLIFTKQQKLTAKLVSVTSQNTYEHVHIQIQLKTNDNKNIDIIGIYRPPNTDKKTFIIELENQINLLHKKNSVIIAGDFNIDLKSKNTDKTQLANITCNSGLMQTIKDYTREEVRDGKLTRSCIDLIFARGFHRNTKSGIVKHKVADHYITVLNFIADKPDRQINKIDKKIQIVDEQKMQKELNAINWTDFDNVNDSVQLYSEIVSTLQKTKQNCTIIRTESKKNRKTPNWRTEEIRKHISKRDILFRKHKNNPTNENYRKEYKRYRNKVTKIIRYTKNNYYRQTFKENQGDIRKTWNMVNQVLGKTTSSIDMVIENNIGKKLTENEITTKFAESYILNIEKLKHKCSIKTYDKNAGDTSNKTFFLPRAKIQDIEKIVDQIDTNKAPGKDEVIHALTHLLLRVLIRYLRSSTKLCCTPFFFPGLCCWALLRVTLSAEVFSKVLPFRVAAASFSDSFCCLLFKFDLEIAGGSFSLLSDLGAFLDSGFFFI